MMNSLAFLGALSGATGQLYSGMREDRLKREKDAKDEASRRREDAQLKEKREHEMALKQKEVDAREDIRKFKEEKARLADSGKQNKAGWNALFDTFNIAKSDAKLDLESYKTELSRMKKDHSALIEGYEETEDKSAYVGSLSPQERATLNKYRDYEDKVRISEDSIAKIGEREIEAKKFNNENPNIPTGMFMQLSELTQKHKDLRARLEEGNIRSEEYKATVNSLEEQLRSSKIQIEEQKRLTKEALKSTKPEGPKPVADKLTHEPRWWEMGSGDFGTPFPSEFKSEKPTGGRGKGKGSGASGGTAGVSTLSPERRRRLLELGLRN